MQVFMIRINNYCAGVLHIVELLADFSTPPDANDVLDDEIEIGQCCYKRN